MRKSTVTVMKYHTRSSPFNSWGPEQQVTLSRFDEMTSTNHYPINTDIDDGGVWILHKEGYTVTKGYYPPMEGFTFYGEFCPGTASSFVNPPAVVEASTNALNAMGTTAIARSAPTRPYVDLASSVAEMYGAGVVPAIPGYRTWQERTAHARSAGSEYLNVEFGWLPLVSDIRKSIYALKHADELIQQYKAGSDQKTRVGYHFEDATSTKIGTYTNFTPYPAAAPYFGTGTISATTLEKTWFSGCFKYHIPLGDDVASKMARYSQYGSRLLGLRLTPEVLWNATPWSWFADWFGNTGDVLRNIGMLGNDGLVLQYGYIMNHRERRLQSRVYYVGGHHLSRDHVQIWKKRLPATPYGFGANLSTLSAHQVSILAALGLSKGVPGFSH